MHVLSACIWVGGHLLLVFMILIPVLKTRNLEPLLDFEQQYEKIGMPALLILVITGLYQAYTYEPNISLWFQFDNHISQHIFMKLIFLFATVGLALNVRFNLLKRIPIPINTLSIHIIIVTIISVFFLMTGISFKYNIF